MLLSDKIIRLRKKNGWSQEELADRINVSRQAVSKWESAQAIPDVEKILQLASLFGVTTDYLLKNELEDEELTASPASGARRVTADEAEAYIEHRRRASWLIALATFLCILSPITLIVLCGAATLPEPWVSEVAACVIGLAVLFAFVLCAVPIFLYCGFKSEPFAFLDKDDFELEYGLRGALTEKRNNFRGTYVGANIAATCLCVASPLPIVFSAFAENSFLSIAMVAVTMAIVSVGVFIFVAVGVRNASLQRLLREGEFANDGKKKEAVELAYWCIIVAVYLGWSFLFDAWGISWLIFPIAGVLSPAVSYVCDLVLGKKNDNE